MLKQKKNKNKKLCQNQKENLKKLRKQKRRNNLKLNKCF